ncbi:MULTISPECIES: TIGR01244 family sulfur transferase [unclassified Thalassospira]|uniref:TIGR01244 family sulfur transferase n=1 Tax=unclassified Thalassospira TaxID=2648997 RepID=UPI000EC741E5|nr:MULTISPECIES: TIGR01244 family sulfur transferase [unclassified Thalassospira]HAI31201.1 TIGR01244 family phosphatase [Thalassospira sp.]|tara:strand:- start:2310 stop:2723 length:414 start_codon:yes stop_codon:yes gene_type:complete
MKRLSDELTVSPQMPLEAIDEIAKAGFKTIICNRPDGEDPGQPSFSEIAAKAEAVGIKAIFQPVASGNVSDADADAFAANLASAPKPIFAYCRSGTRCTILWSLANAGQMPAGDIIKAAAEAGYDMAPLAPRIAARG